MSSEYIKPNECGSIRAALRASVSPPPLKRRRLVESDLNDELSPPETAAVEAGQVTVDDHLTCFSRKLATSSRPLVSQPRISISAYEELFWRNQHDGGSHFVIHQHDHPVAGTHYDLRLQINKSSSVSWAIMYGLPGSPSSRRLNRNATETRIHCLWNHLIETASLQTGSVLIWDTGEYTILPYEEHHETTDEESKELNCRGTASLTVDSSEPAKLHEAFRKGKIRLRLHGTRLPENYTLALRISRSQHQEQSSEVQVAPRKRRRRRRFHYATPVQSITDSENDASRQAPKDSKMDHSDNEEDEEIRRNNAYTGAVNSIGSVHQRTWYLSLDRENSGFQRVRGPDGFSWERVSRQDKLLGFEPFYVQGRDVERSVVTGRLGPEVLADEGAFGYIPRQGWRPVLE